MTEPIWLLKSAVLAVHNQMLVEFGGAEGVRDESLLESALGRPVNLFHNEECVDLAGLAAAYAAGIIRNHPFVDGNKRTGFMAAYIFLDRNGSTLTADEVSATTMTLSLASSELDEEAYATWLGEHTT